MKERRFLNQRMVKVAPVSFPTLRQVRQLIGVVLDSLELLLVGFVAGSRAPRAEQEALQADVHATTLEGLGLARLVKHRLQSLSICVLKHLLDATIDVRLEFLLVHRF